jgi:uncharacterized coiled-coil protein SlyX
MLLALTFAAGCAVRSSPEARIQDLEIMIAAQADSLAKLRSAANASQARVEELEREIARITQLLTRGTERSSGTNRP